MKEKRNLSLDPDYKKWLVKYLPSLSVNQIKEVEEEIKQEVLFLKQLSVKHRALRLKQNELIEWAPKQTNKDIEWVKRLIWKPIGKSDFRRINPVLVEISNEFSSQSFNIWGEERTRTYTNPEPLSKHLDILRTLVSSATNDGFVGRRIQFLVIDKNTKTYLGVICIASALYRVRSIHNEIGWDRELIKKTTKSKMNCMANGQMIVPTQPFGSAYLGGKLLSLLCLSKEVADAWEKNYGDKLVSVHTTSLYGVEKGTQYDNLSPYWNRLQSTSSLQPIKLTNTTYARLKDWMYSKYPEDYYKNFVEKNAKTKMLNVRESKTIALKFCYTKLGLKKDEFIANEERGVYSSFLYTNSKEYLRDEISADELQPAFNNSIDELTDFWRFGSFGDASSLEHSAYIQWLRKTSLVPSKEEKRIQKKKFTSVELTQYINWLKTYDRNYDLTNAHKIPSSSKAIEMKKVQTGQVKGRIDTKLKERTIATQGQGIDWYLELNQMSWDEIQKKYPN